MAFLDDVYILTDLEVYGAQPCMLSQGTQKRAVNGSPCSPPGALSDEW